ncbi:MAG: hypothetical protein SVV03_02015 [Candidatus Nanohaloarchaea archaeon]|nr:hypothetical protein [Candidatus Nanohaloarchaea archaeon]
MAQTAAIFMTFSSLILGMASAVMSFLIIRRTDEAKITTRLVFMLLTSIAFSISLLFYLLKLVFGLPSFAGAGTDTIIVGLILLGVISLNGVLWQEAEYSGMI